MFAGWTAGPDPWLRRGDLTGTDSLADELAGLAEGHAPQFGAPTPDPLLLVCTHGRRDVCCARLGGPLARRGLGDHPRRRHRFAANLVILPHGLYYGPVAGSAAEAAITAYQRGEVLLDRYRGRAGQPPEIQRGDYLAMKASGARSLTALA